MDFAQPIGSSVPLVIIGIFIQYLIAVAAVRLVITVVARRRRARNVEAEEAGQ